MMLTKSELQRFEHGQFEKAIGTEVLRGIIARLTLEDDDNSQSLIIIPRIVLRGNLGVQVNLQMWKITTEIPCIKISFTPSQVSMDEKRIEIQCNNNLVWIYTADNQLCLTLEKFNIVRPSTR